MKTLVVIRDRQQSRLKFISKAKAASESGEVIGKIKQRSPDGAWAFHPELVILFGINRSEMGQISYQMEQ